MSALDWLRRRTALIWVGSFALCAGGVLCASHLPSGIYPEVEFPRIVVVARSGDAPPEVTQVALTRPLETALATVLGVERIRSRTIRGATELWLLFAPGTDMWRALGLVQAHVGEARAALPQGTEIAVERLTTTSFPVVTFNLTGSIDARRLRELAEFGLKPVLSRVRGVGRVEVLGGDVREVEVVLDPERTAALGLSPRAIADKLRAGNVLQAVGRFDEAHSLVTVLASGEPRAVDDLRALPVAIGADGAPIALASVADVREGAEDRLLRVSGPGGETVLVSVARLPGASTPEVVAAVHKAVREVAATLPRGVRVATVYDQAQLVDEAMRSVRDAIACGIALCVAVIALFLRDLRAGLIASAAVPLTLGMTFLAMWMAGQSLNLMSLGGLAVAIGLVIDDAIVVVEAIGRRIEQGMAPAEAASDGTRALMAALCGTTATSVVVFIPLAWLEGVVGRFFGALAVTLAAAVALSLFVAVALVPSLAARFMRPSRRGAARAEGKEGTYASLLRRLVQRPWVGVACLVALLGFGVASAAFVPTGFLPTMDEGAFVLDYFAPAGTSLAETDRIARKIEAVLQATKEVESYSRRTGAELGPAAATQVNRGDIMVRLRSRSRRSRSGEAVIASVREAVEREVPEARCEFLQVLQDVLNDLAGTPRPIEIKLFGADYVQLRAAAHKLAERIRGVDGLVDLYPGFEGQASELRLRVDAAAAARFGQSASDLAGELEAALHGVVASTLRRPERPIGVRVRYPDAVRFDPSKIAALPLALPGRSVLPLAALLAPERAASETELVRENLRPVVIVTADREQRDLGSVMRGVRERLRGFGLPEGYRLELGGQYEGQQATFRELGTVLGFGSLAVLVVLLAQFRRARLALLVLGSVPSALVGALSILWATDIPLNASSSMGCVLLSGLVVKNGILLLEQYETLRDTGVPLADALVQAAQIRARPIAMTTLATIAGLSPLALGLGAGAEIQRPLAVAVIGGLVVSTAVSLLLLPSLAALTAERQARV